METPNPYSTGGGGKVRKQRFRPSSSTPYDRPSSSSRPILPTHSVPREEEEVKKGGWLSKLVDPASRVISRTASRLFSSSVRTHTPLPPPSDPEEHDEFKEEDKLPFNQLSGPETKKENLVDGGISELEQMLTKMNSFSRAEYEHLTDLLRSKTLDVSVEDKPIHNDQVTLEQALQSQSQELVTAFPKQDATEDTFLARISTPGVSLNNNDDETVSPTELAKAFMNSRPSKPLPYNLSVRSQVLKEAVSLPRAVSFNPVASDFSAGRSSTFHFSGFQKDGWSTPKSQRISSLHRMTRSPYFRLPSGVPTQGDESSGKDIVRPSASYSTPSGLYVSKGKQQSVLKRRSSDVNEDPGLFGPTRRTRQRSDFASSARKTPMQFSEKYLCGSDDSQDFTSTVMKTSLLNEENYDTSARKYKKGGEGIISCGNFSSVPEQSAKMAQKILKKLDQFTSPPKKKVFDLKPVPRNMYPSKSLSGISDEQVYNKEGQGKLALPNFSSQTNQVTQSMHKIIQESGPSEPHALRVSKAASKVRDNQMVYSAVDTDHSAEPAREVTADSMIIPPKNTSFQLQASGVSKMTDTNKSETTSQSTMQVYGNGKVVSPWSRDKPVLSDISFQTFPLSSYAETSHEFSSTFSRAADNSSTTDSAVHEQEKSFSFPVSFDSTTSQPPPTPTMATSFGKQSDKSQEEIYAQLGPVKEQNVFPTFSFGLNNIPTLKFSSINFPLGDHDDPIFHFRPVAKPLSTSSINCTQACLGSSISTSSNSEPRSTSIFGQSSPFSDNATSRASTSSSSFSFRLPSSLSTSSIFSSARGGDSCLTTDTTGMPVQVAFNTAFSGKDQPSVGECKTGAKFPSATSLVPKFGQSLNAPIMSFASPLVKETGFQFGNQPIDTAFSGKDEAKSGEFKSDAKVQSVTSVIPKFGQSLNMPIVSSPSPNVTEATVFQFGDQQIQPPLTTQSPVQPSGDHVPQEGNFSLGGGGGVNMANRRIIKVRRDRFKRK